jgi:uncharacterized protein (TIGR03435 family)
MAKPRRSAVVIAAGIAILSASADRRINAAEQEFEVASIRPMDTKAVSHPRQMGPLVFDGQGTLRELITLAYNLERYQVIGGPQWMDSQRYYVRARASSPASPDQICRMLGVLLRNRFQLQVHNSSQVMAAYVLTAAQKGPKLKVAKEGTPRDGRGAIQKIPSGVIARGSTMGLFARFLTIELDFPVLDYTRLDGSYDFDLNYGLTDSSADLSGSLFSSLNDVGLKLKSDKKAPVPVLVVDRAGVPSPN